MANHCDWTLRALRLGLALGTIASQALAGAVQNQQIEISLGQDAATIPDVKWSESDGTGVDTGCLQKRVGITIRLPDGRAYTSPSEITCFTKVHGRIAGLSLTPLRKLTTFEGAVAQVRDIAKALGVENDAALSTRIREWEARQKSEPQTAYNGGCSLGKGASLYIEVRQHPSGKGYYLDVQFYSLKFLQLKGIEDGRSKTGR